MSLGRRYLTVTLPHWTTVQSTGVWRRYRLAGSRDPLWFASLMDTREATSPSSPSPVASRVGRGFVFLFRKLDYGPTRPPVGLAQIFPAWELVYRLNQRSACRPRQFHSTRQLQYRRYDPHSRRRVSHGIGHALSGGSAGTPRHSRRLPDRPAPRNKPTIQG